MQIYKYKYNGKEYQDELSLNLYDYGARNYDPAIGRWMNIDPLAFNSVSLTPYHYAGNSPIVFTDPNGEDWFFYKKEGSDNADYYWHEGNSLDVNVIYLLSYILILIKSQLYIFLK